MDALVQYDHVDQSLGMRQGEARAQCGHGALSLSVEERVAAIHDASRVDDLLAHILTAPSAAGMGLYSAVPQVAGVTAPRPPFLADVKSTVAREPRTPLNDLVTRPDPGSMMPSPPHGSRFPGRRIVESADAAEAET